MPDIADITWEQLNEALGDVNAIQVVGEGQNQRIVIDTSRIAGGTAQNLTDPGVIEVIATLFFAAREAQNDVNSTLPPGRKINAFLQPSQVIQPDGAVLVTQQLQLRVMVTNNLRHAKPPTF